MFQRRIAESNLLVGVLWGLVWFYVAPAGVCAAQTARVGTLHLEGQGIEQLILRDDKGHRQTFQHPEPNLVLPEGNYSIEQITLLGGHSCRLDRSHPARRLAVDPNTSATLSVGAPLQQVIRVSRRGSIMDLAYELIGRGGEHYDIHWDPNCQRPAFAVYRGDDKVASGDFEFG